MSLFMRRVIPYSTNLHAKKWLIRKELHDYRRPTRALESKVPLGAKPLEPDDSVQELRGSFKRLAPVDQVHSRLHGRSQTWLAVRPNRDCRISKIFCLIV